jgi:hypothetical protein
VRKTYFKGKDRSFNLDLFDDWDWLFGPEPVVEEIPLWSEQDIMDISECLLEDSLRNLFDTRCSMKTVAEIHQWMIAINDPNPFSFVNCCKLAGLDADELRDTILDRLKRIRRSIHLH